MFWVSEEQQGKQHKPTSLQAQARGHGRQNGHPRVIGPTEAGIHLRKARNELEGLA